MMRLLISRGDNRETLEVIDCAFSRTSHDQTELHALSVVGSVQVVQAARAMLASQHYYLDSGDIGPGLRFEKNPIVKISKLPKYNQAHMVAMTVNESIIFGEKNEAIESYLMSTAIDTPMLPTWVPYVVNALVEGRFVSSVRGTIAAWNCNFTSATVDAIVSKGVKSGKLKLVAPRLARVGA